MGFEYRVAFVAIATKNIDNLVNFYTNFLENEPITFIPNVYAEFEITGIKLGIFKPKKINESEFETSVKSKISICLEVSRLEDAISHLTSLGYPPPGEMAIASHGREIYAYDPDGNRLILHQAIADNS